MTSVDFRDLTNDLMKYFQYKHLPPHLAKISKLFYDLAKQLNEELPDTFQKVQALQNLLTAKDAAVRAEIK